MTSPQRTTWCNDLDELSTTNMKGSLASSTVTSPPAYVDGATLFNPVTTAGAVLARPLDMTQPPSGGAIEMPAALRGL